MKGRRIVTIHVTSDFQKAFRKLPFAIQAQAHKKDKLFRANAFDPRLKTHKLKGLLRNFWAYSVNYQYRVLFRFIRENEVLYYDVGTHEIYKK